MPSEVGELKELNIVDLDSNNLIGNFPRELVKLQNLTILNISNNALNGHVPSEIKHVNPLKK